MRELGVTASCRSDILLALSEACTNVVEHSSDEHPYEVQLGIDEQQCTIHVRDPGSDFDPEHHAATREGAVDLDRDVDLDAEAGRGIGLMRALVDDLRFAAQPEDAMVVHLYKELEFVEGHPVHERLGT